MPRFGHVEVVTTADRRQTARYEPPVFLPATLARQEAVVVDLSVAGARVYHFAAIKRGEVVRFTLQHRDWSVRTFARVLASTIAGLGNGPEGAPTYESRLHFVDVMPDMTVSIENIMADLQDRQLQRWTKNANGVVGESAFARCGPYFLRMRYIGRTWRKVATHSSRQPDDGFTVPAHTRASELRQICGVYEHADRSGRRMIQLIAAATCEETVT